MKNTEVSEKPTISRRNFLKAGALLAGGIMASGLSVPVVEASPLNVSEKVNFDLEKEISKLKPGETLRLPPGVIETKPISINKAIKIVGAGVNRNGKPLSEIRLASGAVPERKDYIPVIRIKDTENVFIKDCIIDDSGDQNKGFCLSFWNVKNSTAENVIAVNARHFGIHVEGGGNNNFINCRAENINQAVKGREDKQETLGSGIVLSGCDNCLVEGFQARNIKGGAVDLGGTHNCRVLNAEIRHCLGGVMVASSQARTSSGNLVERCLIDYEPTENDFLVRAGIQIVGNEKNLALDNQVKNCRVIHMNDGVFAANYSEGTLIEQCTVAESRASGITLGGTGYVKNSQEIIEKPTIIRDNFVVSNSRGVGGMSKDGIDFTNVDVGIEIDCGHGHIIERNCIWNTETKAGEHNQKWGIATYEGLHPEVNEFKGGSLIIRDNVILFHPKGAIHVPEDSIVEGNFIDSNNVEHIQKLTDKLTEAGLEKYMPGG